MIDSPKNETFGPIHLTADLISAYVANNSVRSDDLIETIHAIYQTLSNLAGPEKPKAEQVEKLTPAQVKKSVTPEALISFEDGKPYKTLRRHLMTRGLTPEDYRTKHGLPVDYPMVSARYSAQRSELARSLGLGQQRNGASTVAEPDEAVSEVPAEKKKAGRPRKAS